MTSGRAEWARACLAVQLLAKNKPGLKGMTVRARAGPVRDQFLAVLDRHLGPFTKVHPAMGIDALMGGLDLAETLSSGRMIERPGLLATGNTLLFAMAERCSPDIAAILANQLDDRSELTLVLLDESAETGEHAPKALTDRLAFDVRLDGIGRLDAKPLPAPRNKTATGKETATNARQSGTSRQSSQNVVTDLTTLACHVGIETMRAPILAVNAAWAHASLEDRNSPNERDIEVAAELVLAPRATRIPESAVPEDEPEVPEPQKKGAKDNLEPDEMLVDAVRAVLPTDLLENLRNSDGNRAAGTGAGQQKKGNRRGRPIPSRPGRLDGSARLDLVATLRAAAPWQKIRGRRGGRLRVLPSDIRLKRFEEKSDRIVVFAVDASGSAALARLGEAKGAVELLLARAYAARDHVALVAFRGDKADLLLPPTRSLVQTKRRLASLPGGGGTPLAHGLKTAAELALHCRGQGMSPVLAILTDGRGNIALDGSANRAQASEDAKQMARWVRGNGTSAVVLDVATRPQQALSELAREMGGTYLALPRADARRLNSALEMALDHGLGS